MPVSAASREAGCGRPVKTMMATMPSASAPMSHVCVCRGKMPGGGVR